LKNTVVEDLGELYGWNPGFGVSPQNDKSLGAMAFGHAAYKQITYDTEMGRSDIFLSKLDITTGVMSPGMDKLLVNFKTGDSEWQKRRELIVHNFPVLLQSPPSIPQAEIVVPAGVEPHMFLSEKAIRDFVGRNLFHQLFSADVTELLDDMFDYDGQMGTALVSGSGAATGPGGVEKLERTRAALYSKAVGSEAAKKFMSAAEKLGLNGEIRLRDFIWIVMFAGYGGTGYLTFETFNMVKTDPAKFLKLYRKDPEAFVLESARLHPPVAGQNPSVLPRDISYKGVDGKQGTFKKGSWASLVTSGANRDPNVFPDPDAFEIERKNLDRILTWNAELGDIRKCNDTAGFPSCKEAPRPCPGTWLALRVAKAAVAFFMDGVEKSLKSRAEL